MNVALIITIVSGISTAITAAEKLCKHGKAAYLYFKKSTNRARASKKGTTRRPTTNYSMRAGTEVFLRSTMGHEMAHASLTGLIKKI